MEVFVKLDSLVPVKRTHLTLARSCALALTDHLASMEIEHAPQSKFPNRINVKFTIKKARQIDVVDQIGRRFWEVPGYHDSSIAFPSARSTRRGVDK
jgi:hypothetical protein